MTIAVGIVIGVVALATLVHLAAPGYRVAGHGPGGAIGEHLAEILRAVISTAGTALLACVGLRRRGRRRDAAAHARRAARASGARCARRGRGDARRRDRVRAGSGGDVFRAILPERATTTTRTTDDVEIEVADDDVLEVGADDAVPSR